MLRIDFEEARGRKKLWKWRWVAKEENFYILDKWLSIREREDRFHLVKKARELEERKTVKGEKIKVRLENEKIVEEEEGKENEKGADTNEKIEEVK
ncbi:hypothetical protein TSAR_006823 [Trichomalopsis sarcophagae]|uniref:Uncharacterized protein n=1 Tax=Trichomalopsis sarcophagae TaxID=543379 RepID=A0A232F395_9HYME|nr:hypothetical protein TSAR_006823 [Trichomalopsis sarcophagae]